MIKQLEDVLRLWYLRHGYYDGSNEWFVIETSFAYRKKTIQIIDLTGKTPSGKYTFVDSDTNRTITAAVKHFNGELILTKEDFRDIWNILNAAIISLEGDKK